MRVLFVCLTHARFPRRRLLHTHAGFPRRRLLQRHSRSSSRRLLRPPLQATSTEAAQQLQKPNRSAPTNRTAHAGRASPRAQPLLGLVPPSRLRSPRLAASVPDRRKRLGSALIVQHPTHRRLRAITHRRSRFPENRPPAESLDAASPHTNHATTVCVGPPQRGDAGWSRNWDTPGSRGPLRCISRLAAPVQIISCGPTSQ